MPISTLPLPDLTFGCQPGNTCDQVGGDQLDGFQSCGRWMIVKLTDEKCQCNKFTDPILKAGCENFLRLYWNNVAITYEQVICPTELSRLPCWEEMDKPTHPPEPFRNFALPTWTRIHPL